MKTRKLGNSGLDFSVIGFGAWALGGGGWAYGWGSQSDKDSIGAIKKAVELGVNWIDTAPVYGLGHSEEVVGKAVKGIRDRVFIATKCGLVWDSSGKIGGRLKKRSVRQELGNSLKRLGVDYVDLYQIHWPSPDEEIEEGWEEISRLIEEGRIKFAGVSNFSIEQIKRAEKIYPVTSLQPPYSMLNRGIESEILEYCKERGIGLVAYSPMACGLLTGKYNRKKIESLPDEDWRKREGKEFHEPRLLANLKLLDKLKPIADRNSVTMPQLAIAWVLKKKAITAAIVGIRKQEQIEETSKAANVTLSDGDMAKIEGYLQERDEILGIKQGLRKDVPAKYE